MIQPDLEILDKILGLLKYGQSCTLLDYAGADSKNCRVEGPRRWTPLLLLLQLFLVVFEGCLKLRVGCLWEDIFTHRVWADRRKFPRFLRWLYNVISERLYVRGRTIYTLFNSIFLAGSTLSLSLSSSVEGLGLLIPCGRINKYWS